MVRFSRKEVGLTMKSILNDEKIQPSRIVESGIQVRLCKYVPSQRLRQLETVLPVAASKLFFYTQYEESLVTGPWRWDLKMPNTELKLPVDTTEFPAGRMWITAASDEKTGLFTSTPHRYRGPDNREASCNLKTDVKLHISGKKTGFILYKPKAKYPSEWETFREMSEAPTEGYVSSIPIDMVWVNRLGKHHCGVFFYFRGPDGRFGKGIAVGGTPAGGKSKSGLLLNIYMQRDGSRNLHTN